MNNLLQKNIKMYVFLFFGIFILGCSSDDDVATIPEKPVSEEDVPVAVDDEYVTNENTAIEIDDLLENDTIFEYARVVDFDSETAEGGTVEDNRDGTFIYTPPQNFSGEDTFEYTICDNASTPNCDSATVTIMVTDATPVARDDAYETEEDKVLSIVNYLDNDDLVNNTSIASVDYEDSEGIAVIEDDGTITYTPADGYAGEDSFTYTICDQGEDPTCATATITVNVLDEGSPVANDDTLVIDMNASEFTITSLLNNDIVIDGAVITSVTDTNTRGNITLNEDGSISYTPENGYLGDDTFTYSLCDDDQPEPTCSTATVTITLVDPVSFNIPSEVADYYEGLAVSQNEDLNYKVISELTRGMHTTILSYGQRHEYLYNADEDLQNPDNVVLIYSGESRYWEEYTSGSNSYMPQTFNTEHSFPQSRLSSDEAVTDLHHLRVADDEVNELRSNNPYTDGSGNYESVNDNAFFPGDEWKGDVARMILYLNVRYNEDISKVGNLELFLKWNREDPVSAFEMQRNNVIEGAQGNRNPFIDNPYLVTLIWGGDAAENTWE
ncbi:endonuclease [Salegentibacter sp. LM13S]|uniref:Ig-like domain-containing protein n=1 Tax=Salegentibacter lacus TaxID=2873599 RepID=UPI001CCFC6EC|nr:Ig-like domain-containing protein [Salegentibacter lacus]MBZ9629446.1 endonuclease [Salegentibacter lacus]